MMRLISSICISYRFAIWRYSRHCIEHADFWYRRYYRCRAAGFIYIYAQLFLRVWFLPRVNKNTNGHYCRRSLSTGALLRMSIMSRYIIIELGAKDGPRDYAAANIQGAVSRTQYARLTLLLRYASTIVNSSAILIYREVLKYFNDMRRAKRDWAYDMLRLYFTGLPFA